MAQRKKAHLYRLVALFDQGDVVPAWGTAGRKPVMDLDAVKAFVESFTAQGASITREDWRAQLKKAAAASTDTNADGTLLYGRGWEPNRHTIDQYMQLSLEWGEKTNENKVPEKSMQRIMAESSVISMMSNAIATTYSLVRICEEGCALNPPPPGNDIARYWAKVYGVSTKCLDLLDPALVSNTDGTTRFVYEGKDKKGGKDNWVISPKDGAGLTSARSTFTTGTTTPTNGLRVELLFSFDAGGGAAPLCALVSLNERECSGLKIVQVPVGLSPYDTNLGTVMFIGPSNGEEPNETPAVLAAKHYHAVVLQNWYRAKRRARGYVDGTPVPPHLKGLLSCDGALAMLKAILLCLPEDQEARIDNLKIAAAMTGVAQPDDLMAVFRLITHLAKFMEASDTKVSKVLKAHLLTEFRKIDGLNLSTVKMNALVDFLATLPQILAKAVTPTHIENGFFRAGWFSDTESGWPTLDGFFNQLRQKLTEEEKARCRSNFVELASMHRDQGYIDDAEYEALNFPTDKHPIDGREIRRNSHAPHLMRGMTFGHLALQKEREELVQQQKEKEQKKTQEEGQRVRSLLSANSACEGAVREAAAVRLAAVPTGDALVGVRVKLWWANEKKWYAAAVTEYGRGKNKQKHLVEYDGGGDSDDDVVAERLEAVLSMGVGELRGELRARELPAVGGRAVLSARLKEAISQEKYVEEEELDLDGGKVKFRLEEMAMPPIGGATVADFKKASAKELQVIGCPSM